MLAETLEMDEDEELEEEADAEVDKVLFELTNGKLGEAGTVGINLPVNLLFSGLIQDTEMLYSQWKTNWRKKKPKEIWRDIDRN